MSWTESAAKWLSEMDMAKAKDLASLFAVAISLAALWLNYRTRRQVKRDRKPVVTVKQVTSNVEHPGWECVRIKLRSRSTLGVELMAVGVVWPLNSRVVRLLEVWRNPISYEAPATVEIPDKPSRWVRGTLAVTQAGKPTQQHGYGLTTFGEDGHEDCLLRYSHISISWRRRLMAWALSVVRRTSSAAARNSPTTFSMERASQRMVLIVFTRMEQSLPRMTLKTVKIRAASQKKASA